MVDKHDEIYPLINLISESKIKINKNNSKNIEQLKDNLNGIISYCDVKNDKPNISIVGVKLPLLKFKVYVSFMKGYQLEAWKKLNERKKKERKGDIGKKDFDAIHKNRIYCSNIVFSNLKYGSEMKHECINEIELNNEKRFYFKKHVNINLDNIENYSSKISSMLKLSLNVNGPIYVYCEDIEGSGLKILSAILENIGYKIFNKWDKDIKKGKRFVLCTGDSDVTPKMEHLINSFCRNENKNGEYIKYFLGSKVVSESINLKNIRQIHILTPHWNLPVINQAIGRSIRKFSHDLLDTNLRNVDIFLHCAVAIYNGVKYDTLFYDKKNLYKFSIDYYKYVRAQYKYNDIIHIKNILKEISVNKYINCNKKIDKKKIDFFTYKAFYSNNLADYVVDLIVKEINKTGINYLSKSYIFSKIDINKEILEYILYKKINNKKLVKDKYLQTRIITLNNDMICLKTHNDKNNDINIHLFKYYDKKKNIIINNNNFNINTVLNEKQLVILNYKEINLAFINEIFKLDTKELVELLEYGFINNISIIKIYFSTFFIYNNNIVYHNLCYFDLNDKICSYSVSSGNYNVSGKTRKYDSYKKKWTYINDYNLETILKNYNKKKLKQNNNFKVYLLISNSDKTFRLCNKITENIYESKVDKRKIKRGKCLDSYTPGELKKIYKYLLNILSYTLYLNIINKMKIINFDILSLGIKREIIKYILFTNKMYLIH